jgi:anti-sigma regulatory factor (Ser/Thr protein kinase)
VRSHGGRQHDPCSGSGAGQGQVDRRAVVVEHGPLGPRQARTAVEQWAHEAGAERLCDDLVLIVSELVTNAVRYGAPPVRVEVQADPSTVTIAVVDGDPAPPVRRDAPEDAESGRGMLLIELVAAEHGVRSDPPGKAVWAAFSRAG